MSVSRPSSVSRSTITVAAGMASGSHQDAAGLEAAELLGSGRSDGLTGRTIPLGSAGGDGRQPPRVVVLTSLRANAAGREDLRTIFSKKTPKRSLIALTAS
jgi:hypothetical protein